MMIPMLIQQFFSPLFSGLTGRCCVCTTLIDTQHVKQQTMNIFVRKRVRGKTRPLLMSQGKVEQSVYRKFDFGSHFCCGQHHTRDIGSQTNMWLNPFAEQKMIGWMTTISIHYMSYGNILKRHLKFNLRVRTYLCTKCPSPCHPSDQKKKFTKKVKCRDSHTKKEKGEEAGEEEKQIIIAFF